MHGLMTGLVQNAENTLNELTQGVVNGIRAIHGQNPGVHSEAATEYYGSCTIPQTAWLWGRGLGLQSLCM
jgi:hypothetical protein